jgi:hypothetical protein
MEEAKPRPPCTMRARRRIRRILPRAQVLLVAKGAAVGYDARWRRLTFFPVDTYATRSRRRPVRWLAGEHATITAPPPSVVVVTVITVGGGANPGALTPARFAGA